MRADQRAEDRNPFVEFLRPAIIDTPLIFLELLASSSVYAESHISEQNESSRSDFLLFSLEDCSLKPVLVVPGVHDVVNTVDQVLHAPLVVFLGLLAEGSDSHVPSIDHFVVVLGGIWKLDL